jgi:pimeloyl-ACP methyl ester carboxylesterase
MARGKLSSATFVLVHGAWHGGWCWARVARMLRDVGHTVHTPTLTGLGDRAHLARPDIDLALHVQDVVALLETEELRQAILVGHGYGGMVITGVAARAGARLAHLVYLDAFVPADGQPLLSLVSNEMAANVRAAAQAHGDGWRIPPLPPERYGVTNPKDVEWLTRHLVPHPLKTVEQPVQAKERPSLKRTFIYCAKPAMGPFDQFVALKNDRAWRFHELATGHDAMITATPDLAKILADTAG